MSYFATVEDQGSIEASGSVPAHPWYVLWTYDRHRFVVPIPSLLHERVISVQVVGENGQTLAPPQTPIYEGENCYLEFNTATASSNIVAHAVITVLDKTQRSQTDTLLSETVEYTVHKIDNVSWVSRSECEKDYSASPVVLAAELVNNTIYQVPYDGNFDPYYNELQLKTQISPLIPTARHGSISIEWYDPDNIAGTNNNIVSANAGARRDNGPQGRGTLTFDSSKTLEYSNPVQSGSFVTIENDKMIHCSRIRLAQDCYQSNFLVACHPRVSNPYGDSDTTAYLFGQTGQDLMYKERTGDILSNPASVPEQLRSPIVTVQSWKGFRFPPEMVAAGKWVYDNVNYTMRTPYFTSWYCAGQNLASFDLENDLSKASESAPTKTINGLVYSPASTEVNNSLSPESVIDYDFKFTLTSNFEFVGPTYVTPIRDNALLAKHPHRSFHRNSGIYIYNLIEVQIYDSAGLPSTLTEGSINVRWQGETRSTSGIKVSQPSDSGFETISGCVTNILYQSETWHDKTLAQLRNAGTNTVNFTFTPSFNAKGKLASYDANINGDIRLFFGTGSKGAVTLSDTTQGSPRLYLQSHWGSGVKFSDITINEVKP